MKRALLLLVSAGSLLAQDESSITDLSDEVRGRGPKSDHRLPITDHRLPITEGLQVVERSQPKVLGSIPAGWKLAPLEEAVIESDPIQLKPGVAPVLRVQPYKLVPDPDQGRAEVKDPGYKPDMGVRQDSTIGAILTRQNAEAEELGQKLTAAIDQLQAELQKIDSEEPKPTKKSGGGQKASP